MENKITFLSALEPIVIKYQNMGFKNLYRLANEKFTDGEEIIVEQRTYQVELEIRKMGIFRKKIKFEIGLFDKKLFDTYKSVGFLMESDGKVQPLD